MALNRAPDVRLADSVLANRVRFTFGLVLVTIGAGLCRRVSRIAAPLTLCGADNVVDSIARLPRWLRLTVPVAAAALAGSITRLRSSRTQGVSNVMEAIALGRVHLQRRSKDKLGLCMYVFVCAGIAEVGKTSCEMDAQLIECRRSC